MGASRSRRLWGRVAIVVVSLGLAAAVTFGAFALAFALIDNPRRLDDDGVVTVVRDECARMRSTVDKLAKNAESDDDDERFIALEDQNLAIEKMLNRLASIPPTVRADDRPLDAWLADWEAILNARRAYIERASIGALTSFHMPSTQDGDPISGRMDKAAPGVCRVPTELLEPDDVGGQQA